MLEPLLRNWHLKVLALCLAFAVWIAVTGENRVLQVYEVPLDIVLRADHVLKSPAPATATVSLRGPESRVRRLDPRSMVLRADLTDATPGPRSVPLSSDNLQGLPADLEVADVEPSRLRLEIDRRLRKSVPVAPSVAGAPPAGYAFYGARVEPGAVAIEGPESVVGGSERLRTDTIRLDGRTSPFVVPVGAAPEHPSVRVLETRPLEVEVQVDVSPVRRSFDGVPITLDGRSPDEATIGPPSVRVVVTGPPALLSGMRTGRIRAVADLGALGAEGAGGTVPVRVEFPDLAESDLRRVEVRSVSPPRVSVRPSPRRAPA